MQSRNLIDGRVAFDGIAHALDQPFPKCFDFRFFDGVNCVENFGRVACHCPPAQEEKRNAAAELLREKLF
jgi:hypothetical protein